MLSRFGYCILFKRIFYVCQISRRLFVPVIRHGRVEECFDIGGSNFRTCYTDIVENKTFNPVRRIVSEREITLRRSIENFYIPENYAICRPWRKRDRTVVVIVSEIRYV